VQSSAGNLLASTDAHALARLVQALAAVTAGKKTQVADIVGGLDRFTGTISARQQQVAALIDAAEQLSGTLAGRDRQLGPVIDDLNAVVSGLASHSAQLGTLIDNTELAASETASLVGRNNPRLRQMLDALHADLQILDLAQGVAYAGAAVNGFQSVGYSGTANTPNSWANIFVNLASVAGVDGVLGSCGALDQALDVALGPDPWACDARNGPLPAGNGASSGSPASASTGGAGSGAGSKSGAGIGGGLGALGGLGGLGGLAGGGTGAPAGSSGAGALWSLLSPFAGVQGSGAGGR